MFTLFAGLGTLAVLMPFIFSLAGLGAAVLLLLAGAIAAAWFGFRRLALLLLAVAIADVAGGVVYRAGVKDCQARVAIAVAAERDRQAQGQRRGDRFPRGQAQPRRRRAGGRRRQGRRL
jgi:O-antigen ligase